MCRAPDEAPRRAVSEGVIISDEPRINDEIRVPQVRLIGPNGEQVGVIATSVALNLAREANLDLVEVAPNAKPPVTKLIDYGKFKYTEKIKAREARRNQSTAEVKEIRFRLKIDSHDFEVKKGHVSRFLQGGDKVKVTIMLRGREQSRPIGGVELLRRLADEISDLGSIESSPKQEGRNIIMTLAPKGKKVHTQSEQRRRGDQAKAERQARQAARLAAKQEAKPQTASEAGERIHKASTSTQSSKPAASVAAKGMHAVTSTKTSVNKTTTKEDSNAEDEK
ncbi:translation initiation factor IF-3 [Bifidobacterium psychraerophilum]|uniref:translation initiation factor IF-3 n=1 Tax=Bifidobacterium psychraerophilum TaxID=218140 RepID=UPI0023F3823D|nr:translation initiation factor IF-3 [Bifidobacterium psychraerophilum]MCI1660343.1 translation initiation factor IF-3 [Bifidobacterium psychraerophilum]MCI1804223.1 translation initiation factor IF-3 [Bifidobacterium psychraerophilum]MCI2176670.1 translation initiation factor IF-3 [Bifidobacterium psychraerophilum]MCI2181519.1 translation initiation factor IF-3 [Bifidobacterium psychraerophilum]